MNFTEYVAIYERLGTVDSLGQKVETWNRVASTWAQVSTKTGYENIQGSQLVAVVTKFFKIRYISTVRPDMRITYDGENYNIIALNFDRRDNTLMISANLVDNQ